MRKAISFLILTSLLLSACAPVRPIRELRIAETVGCDLSPEGAALSVCVSEPQLRLTQDAPSLRLAMDRLREQAASPALFFAHTQFVLAGRALAADDLRPVLDLVARSEDMRLGTPLFLVKNAPAADAVRAGDDERDATAMLSALREDMAQQGVSHAFSCGELLETLHERGAALAAACALEDGSLRPAGYGVLKEGRCVAWIGGEAAQGVTLLRALGGHGDVRLDGATVTISDCETDIAPQWEGSRLIQLNISVHLRAALTETDGQPGVTDEAGREALERALSNTARGWCETLLRRAQALGADFLDLGGAIARRDPLRWSAARAGWQEIFPNLPWTVTVTATLDRTLDLGAPLTTGGAP